MSSPFTDCGAGVTLLVVWKEQSFPVTMEHVPWVLLLRAETPALLGPCPTQGREGRGCGSSICGRGGGGSCLLSSFAFQNIADGDGSLGRI